MTGPGKTKTADGLERLRDWARLAWFEPAAVWALLQLSLRQSLRARRVLVVLLLLALPCVIAVLVRYDDVQNRDATLAQSVARRAEQALIFLVIPHALAPLVALIFSAGLLRDEIEDQTLTYLVVRPLPKWSIYASKLAAAMVTTCVVTSAFVLLVFVILHAGRGDFWRDVFFARAVKAACLVSLSLCAYCSIFGLIGLMVKRALALGVAYIILFEGALANIDFVVRRATVMYYFRVLCRRWLGLEIFDWNINLSQSPSAVVCVAVLLGGCLVATILAGIIFSVREFRLKTPEGV
jgi:ABC-2 type transport system permease protein